MDINKDPYSDIEVEILDEAGVQEAIDHALARAGCSWEELQEQAKAGRFRDEVARRVWFAVSSFAEPSQA
ncbi:MAG: hypothetical protein F4089_10825 [Gammaproteobacteria bacterium]|nr:hypothetical protein [Gammaproteobacteria bacterium]